jgi:cytochrome c oxidase subunit II
VPFRSTFQQVLPIWAGIAAGVFLIVILLLFFAVIRNRASRRTDLPFSVSKNTAAETTYAVVLVGIIAGLSVGSYLFNVDDGAGAGTPAAKVVGPVANINVIAHRWCWRFEYAAAPVTVDGECTSGQYPTVVVPTGRTVDFALTSTDVVHAFWLPHFAAKRDVYPDHVNHLRMTFDRAGRWHGRCSEFCGTHHVTMDFWVRAVSPTEYQHFLDSGGIAA